MIVFYFHRLNLDTRKYRSSIWHEGEVISTQLVRAVSWPSLPLPENSWNSHVVPQFTRHFARFAFLSSIAFWRSFWHFAMCLPRVRLAWLLEHSPVQLQSGHLTMVIPLHLLFLTRAFSVTFLVILIIRKLIAWNLNGAILVLIKHFSSHNASERPPG